MKKAADASPNRALKRERELRCWSQLELADRINTTAFNVGRWERGITFPSAYFRQQLCTVFGKSPRELGLLNATGEEVQSQEDAPQENVATSAEGDETGTQLAEASAPTTIPVRVNAPVADTPPPIWNIPYRRNPFFTGREETLEALHQTFAGTGEGTPAQILAISGLGGMGKTQTTIEYVYRYRNEYRVLLWAKADTREVLITDFSGIAALLELPESKDQDQSHAVAAVKRWMSRQTDWLLVFDNADDLAMVSDFIPETIGGHILLTTRAQSTGHLAPRVLVEKLSAEEGAMFLLRRAKILGNAAPLDTTWTHARAIAKVMDGLPLALDQAAGYIEETGCGLDGYMERYQRHGVELLRRRGGLRPEHPEPVATTWSLSFKQIERANPPSGELLRLCAFLHPDSISEEVLIDGMHELTPNLHLLSTDILEMDAAISALTMFSLLRRDPGKRVLALHRLVQIVLRNHMDDETQRLWAERAVRVIDRAFPVVNFTNWARCQQCLSHAQICAECIVQLHITLPEGISLLNKAGSYLRERAQYSEAERLLTYALTLSKEVLETEDPLLAESLNNLGMLLHDQGKYAQAETFLQRALTIYQRVRGLDHIDVAQCLSNLAGNYRVQGRQGEMETAVKRALAIREKALGPEHPDVARSLNQLASLYHGQGKYHLAEPLYWRALTIHQQALGPEHIDVAESLNNLAYLYHAVGKYAQAEPLYQQALAFCEKNLGAYHMYTAASLGNLAEVYRAQGEFTSAEELHRRTLNIREQTLGLDHPDTGKSQNWLAEIYLSQQKYSQAEELALRALATWEKNLGPAHYNTANGLDTLARLRRVQGRLDQAETLSLRALAIYRKIWEGDNQYVASSLNTLAEIYFDQGKYAQAGGLLQEALRVQEQTLSLEHPDTARSLHNLGRLSLQQRDDALAESYLARAFSIRKQALLSQHPELVLLFQQYRAFLQEIGDTDRLLLLEKEMHIMEKTTQESFIS